MAELAVLDLLAAGPDAGVEAGLFLMKAAAPLPPRGLGQAGGLLPADGLRLEEAGR